MAVHATGTLIAKYALSKIGGGAASNQLNNINGSTATEIAMRELYEVVRMEVLTAGFWVEATKYADLGAEVTGVEKAGWDYAFNLPGDYLGLCQLVYEKYHTETAGEQIKTFPCEVSSQYLLTSWLTNTAGDSAYIRYVWDLQVTGRMSPQLVEAFATKLGAEAAPKILTEKSEGYGRRQAILNEYETKLPAWLGRNQLSQYRRNEKGEATTLTSASRWE